MGSIFTEIFETGGSFEYVGRAVTLKIHRTLWLAGLGNVIMKKGKPVKLIGTIQDVTKSKTTGLEIQKLSVRLSLATKSAGIGVWEEDVINEELIWDNEISKIFTGVVSKKWNDESARNITHPDDIHIM